MYRLGLGRERARAPLFISSPRMRFGQRRVAARRSATSSASKRFTSGMVHPGDISHLEKWNGSSWGHLSSGAGRWRSFAACFGSSSCFMVGWLWGRGGGGMMYVVHRYVKRVESHKSVTSPGVRGLDVRGDTCGARRVLSCFKETRGRRTGLFALSASHRFRLCAFRIVGDSADEFPDPGGVAPCVAPVARRRRAPPGPAGCRWTILPVLDVRTDAPPSAPIRRAPPGPAAGARAGQRRQKRGAGRAGRRRGRARGASSLLCSFAPATSRTHGAL